MDMTDQDIDIAGTEADEGFWQRHDALPEGHDPALPSSGAVDDPRRADDEPRGEPPSGEQAQDLK